VTPIGHPAALRRLYRGFARPDGAKAVAMVAVTSTSFYCGKHGLERGSNYLLALFGNRLVLARPTREPDANAVLLDFVKGSYRVTDAESGRLNVSFVLSRPYGSVHLRMLRWGPYAVNDQVLERLTAAAAAAERSAARTPPPPLRTAGDVRVFARMCAAFGPGAERATAVAEVEVVGAPGGRGLAGRKPATLLAAFGDRVVLLDPAATSHVGSAPLAAFARGATTVASVARGAKHLDVTLTGPDGPTALRVSLYGEDRIDDLVVAAITGLGSTDGTPQR